MTVKRILYYTWHEITYHDCIESMCQLGYTVDVATGSFLDYDMDEEFLSKFISCCKAHAYDCIFTFNYFPIISRAAVQCQLKYIAWVYDSPHPTLDSVTLANDYNAVFLFDYLLYEKYRKKGIQTVYYMPLAYNPYRLDQAIRNIPPHYEHDITFLGTLYEDAYNFYDQINYLPPYLEGYIRAIIDAQQLIFGLDLCSLLFDHGKCEEMAKYVRIDMGKQYSDYRDDLFRDMIRKKVTVIERKNTLSIIAQKYTVDLYSPKKPENLSVNYKGYADYTNQMPQIFYTSKINLNITLRSILSGIPLRVIDILGAHGFLLTNYQAELSEYFVNGEDLVWYESMEDMMDKISFFLTHDSERERIASNGSFKVQKYFSYTELLQKIFQMALSF